MVDLYTSYVCTYGLLRYTVPFVHGSVPKSTKFINEVVPLLDDDRFKILFRISRRTFNKIFDLIKDDEVFRPKHRGRSQYSVEVQLQIVLFRLGCSGEAGSIAKTAFLFGTGDGGTIQNCTKRVFSALMKHKTRYIYWPDKEERNAIERATSHEMPHCIGYLDGTELKLAEKPYEDPDSYLSRKQHHSVKAQIICDYKLRIRHLVVGYPGSVHDARMFKNCPIALYPEKYFNKNQYLLGDSAYKLTGTVITPFRANSKGIGATTAGRKFNKTLGKYRVRVENTIGLLKERFCSLKEVKIPIIDDDSIKFLNEWTCVCSILHNFILDADDINDTIDFEQSMFEFGSHEDLFESVQSNNVDGEAKRQALVNLLARINSR